MHQVLLVLHLLAATVWIGGHLVLLLTIVPAACRTRNPHLILNFERSFEKFGMGSLVVLVASGVAMALSYSVAPQTWFHFATPVERVVSLKLSLLMFTVAFALSAQLRYIPRLKTGSTNLTPMVIHIAGVTLIGVAMLVLGIFVRFGGLR